MKRVRSGSFVLLLVVWTLAPGTAAAEERPWIGGFGHMVTGLAFGQLGNLAGQLGHSEGLGATPEEYGYTVGGGGRMMITDYLFLGGRGYLMVLPEFSSDRGSAALYGGGGGVDLGVLIHNRDKVMLYPFVGVGGLGLNLEITNNSDKEIRFGKERIKAGEQKSLRTGFWYLEVGFGVQRLLFADKQQGGWVIGAEVGVQLSPRSEWMDEDDRELAGVNPARLASGFFRITVGGGGFFYR